MKSKRWKRLEELVKKDIGGTIMPGSGRFVGAKEDVHSEHLIVQCKSTKGVRVYLTLEEMSNLAGHAENNNKCPALAFLTRDEFNSQYKIVLPMDYPGIQEHFVPQNGYSSRRNLTKGGNIPFTEENCRIHSIMKGIIIGPDKYMKKLSDIWSYIIVVTREEFIEGYGNWTGDQ